MCENDFLVNFMSEDGSLARVRSEGVFLDRFRCLADNPRKITAVVELHGGL